ncbi:MAG: FAD-dependent oxidoreductase [Planctomycetia bacterium]|nr:FAD-dependent oxidoreductase [Planctomycetia bacterium]
MNPITIVGAGLAGLSAAVRLLQKLPPDRPVHLFDRARTLGGRAASLFLPDKKIFIDRAQHLSMNACGCFRHFLRQTALEPYWKEQDTLTFLSRDDSGKNIFSTLRNSPIMPPPFHLLGSILRLRFLCLNDRLALLRTLQRLRNARLPEGIVFAQWLDAAACPTAVRLAFFEPVVVSAFCDTSENVSARRVHLLFRRVFFGSPDGWHPLLPTLPLQEIFHDKMLAFFRPFIAQKRLEIHLGETVERLPRDGTTIVAVNPESAAELGMPVPPGRNTPSHSIAALHFWTRRPLFRPPHLSLVGPTAIQWIFRVPFTDQNGHFGYQALVSHSDVCATSQRDALRQILLDEIHGLFPNIEMLDPHITRVPHAVTPCDVASETNRPGTLTAMPNVFLAGDWTATGLPATMEGAVQSGYAAAEAAIN